VRDGSVGKKSGRGGGRDVPMPLALMRSASLAQRGLEKEMLHSSKTPWRSLESVLVDE
jgi:hypothetical protein